FFARESCGKCVPCREGTSWVHVLLRRIARGRGTARDLALLEDMTKNVGGRKTLCALGDFSCNAVWSGLKYFRGEFERRLVVAGEAPGSTGAVTELASQAGA